MVESVVVEVSVVEVELDNEAVVLLFPLVVPLVATPADRFFRLADVTPAAIITTNIPANNSVADLFKLRLKILNNFARKIEIANKLS
jgi:hypothetical protein